MERCKRPTVSAIVSAGDSAELLGRTLAALSAQTRQDFEVLIYGPQAEAPPQSYPTRYERSLENALQSARGDYLIWQQAGDESVPQRLATQIAYLESNLQVSLVGAAIGKIDGRGVRSAEAQMSIVDELLAWRLLFYNCLPRSSVMVRRRRFVEAGGFDHSYPHAADWACWVRLSRSGALARLSACLVYCPEPVDQAAAQQAWQTRQADEDQVRRLALEQLLQQSLSMTEVTLFRRVLAGKSISSAEMRINRQLLNQLHRAYLQRYPLTPDAQKRLVDEVAEYFLIVSGPRFVSTQIEALRGTLRSFRDAGPLSLKQRLQQLRPIVRRHQQKALAHAQKTRFVDAGRLADVVLLCGMGRSGTTWLSEIVNHDNSYRVLFEPFWPARVAAAKHFEHLAYLRVADHNEQLATQARQILSGKLRTPWVDRDVKRFFYRRRIVKDIRCNLMIGWLQQAAGHPPTVLIVRHPLQVALSWRKLRWATNLDAILEKEPLLNDFPVIHEVARSINRADAIESVVFLWCVLHLVPAVQLHAATTHLVFYENLLTNFEAEVVRLFRYLDRPLPSSNLTQLERKMSSTNFLKRTQSTGRVHLLTGWKNDLSAEQIRRAHDILAAFKLDHLYDQNGTPSNYHNPAQHGFFLDN